ncbi:MAG TPA: hypothetical protein VGR37_08910 [Longimicrobiaceae bacterium]|nr:hypothetical protein [Longimicrobiaceae bacterium]
MKIAATVLFWAGPLLLVPEQLLAAAGLCGKAVPLVRLLGCAYTALCIGYGFGLREVYSGRRPMGAIAVGIVSNAGAGAYLTYFGVTDGWVGWPLVVTVAAWASAAATLGIAFGLYWFGLRDVTGSGSRTATGSVRRTVR